MLPYSTRFIGVSGLTSSVDFVVPAGFVAVVKEITVFAGNYYPGNRCYVHQLPDGWEFFGQDSSSVPGDSTYGQWSGAVVLEAGETIEAVGGLPGFIAWDVYVGGYLLTAL